MIEMRYKVTRTHTLARAHTHTNKSVAIGGERTLDATNRLLNRVEHKRGKENRQDLKDRCVEYYYLI